MNCRSRSLYSLLYNVRVSDRIPRAEESLVLFKPDRSVMHLIARFDVHVETDRGH